MNTLRRPRRNRATPAFRALVRETVLAASDFVYPVFVMEGHDLCEPIASMPGQFRYSLDRLLLELAEVVALGIPAVGLFPAVPHAMKTPLAEESCNPQGLVQRAVRAIKQAFPQLVVITDVALDPYNSDGHDGLVSESGEILNDETVGVLCTMALSHAQAGADCVAPSDMMDGRVGAIRRALDSAGYTGVGIIAYSAKYASAYYGPFREALQSAPKAGDKKTYQMDPANSKEAMLEISLDVEEGADVVMVKPAGAYLDIIHAASERFDVPVAAYQVSGEYAMICAAAQNGWIVRDQIILESLLGIKRAGAKMIWTYFAKDAAKLLAV